MPSCGHDARSARGCAPGPPPNKGGCRLDAQADAGAGWLLLLALWAARRRRRA
ncbi:MYXO-CTERM sorting domain-containing protein [Nannocystis pusilla]|uniref:MYXO-CTERM sorting domain-containing protein n=1 Tax=Nannocystis pusilla TaxID=889268 RepID=UPI003B78BD47